VRKYIELISNENTKIAVSVDEDNADKIAAYIEKQQIGIMYEDIVSSILEQKHNKKLYRKVVNTKSIYEMRFVRFGKNDRIYCKEMIEATKRLIIMRLLYKSKKSDNSIPKHIFKELKKIDKEKYEKQN
jgi:hypothetical protein